MNFQLNNKGTISAIIALVIISTSLFYWFQLRPAKIRHDCSWTKVVNPATSLKPAITKEEVRSAKQKYDQCYAKQKEELAIDPNQSRLTDPFLFDYCDSFLKQEREAIPAKPETHWYRRSDETEYNFCIHENGLQ